MFAVAVGLGIALLSYRWIVDPSPRAAREQEEQVVAVSRSRLAETLDLGEIEIVDPLAPDRSVGKVYIYPAADGWEVSGYYRRGAGDRWHAYLMRLDASLGLTGLKVADRDPELLERAAGEPALEAVP